MKKFIFLFIALQMAFVCKAWEPKMPQRGYRGFVDLEFSTGKEHNNVDMGEDEAYHFFGLATSHGYQFNRHLFLGAGAMFSALSSRINVLMPVFAHFRYDTAFSRFTPFGDIRLGYNVIDGDKGTGVYFSPSVGYRFNWGRRLNLNLGLGMTVLGTSYKDYDYIEGGPSKGSYNVIKEHGTDIFFTVRLGIDF